MINNKSEIEKSWRDLIDQWENEEQQVTAPKLTSTSYFPEKSSDQGFVFSLLKIASLGGVMIVLGLLSNAFISTDDKFTTPRNSQTVIVDPWLESTPCSIPNSCINQNNHMENFY